MTHSNPLATIAGYATASLKRIALVLAFLVGCALPALAPAAERSDILLNIVSSCVDPAAANYCSLCSVPRSDSACGAALDCKQNTEVWALNERFAVIRDIKMCGCPAGFVHGLAMPRHPVRGVEDPNRPDAIWKFAWDAAAAHIETESIALVVNPRLRRSQNQLHVHLLRLVPGAREKLEPLVVGTVENLEQVWATATFGAMARGLDDYGVLVLQRAQKDYQIVVTPYSPEKAFTVERCN